MTFATLRALHAVIGAAIDDIERVYRERSPQDSLVEYPSLNEPYYRTAQHTSEEELAEALKEDPNVSIASKRIVAACSQLSITVNKPWSGLMEDVMWAQFSFAIRFLEAANIVEILRDAGPGGLHVREIHRLILELRTNARTAAPPDAVPMTPFHLSHILRLLATGHYLREIMPDVFANNRMSSYIDSGKTLSQLRAEPGKKYHDTDGVAAYVGTFGDEVLKTAAYLTEWALPEKRGAMGRDAGTDFDYTQPPELLGQSAAPGRKGAVTSDTHHHATAFNFAFNTGLGFFSWLELPENEGRFVRLGHAMAGSRQCESMDAVLRGFSWEKLPRGAALVDVGGGIGSQGMLVAQAHPHIHVVAEDRDHVVSTAASALLGRSGT